MKRKLIYVIILLASVLLVGCSNNKSPDNKDWKTTQLSVVNNFEQVSMNVIEDSVSSKEVTVIFTNSSKKQAIYSEDFLLEKNIGDNWYQVPTKKIEFGFNDIAYELSPSTKEVSTINWDWLYGSLDKGEYRIVKTLWVVGAAGVYEEYYLAGQFIVD